MTTIKLFNDKAVIDTDVKTAVHLLKKNPNCTSEVNDSQAHLVYDIGQLNVITSILKHTNYA